MQNKLRSKLKYFWLCTYLLVVSLLGVFFISPLIAGHSIWVRYGGWVAIIAVPLWIWWWLVSFYAQLLTRRGATLLEQNKLEEALISLETAYAIKPGNADLLFNRGIALTNLNQGEEALKSFDDALGIRPGWLAAHYKKGALLQRLGRPEAALAAYEQALMLDANHADALYNRSLALQELKRLPEAVESYDRLLKIKPEDVEALNGRGNALMELRRIPEAVQSYVSAIKLKPDFADARYNYAVAMQESKYFEQASGSFVKLLEIAPNYPFARGKFMHMRMLCCNWKKFDAYVKSLHQDVRKRKKSADPFGYLALAESAQDLMICNEVYGSQYFVRPQDRLWNGERYGNPKIRIGYVSGEFRHQATSILMASLFELHDKSRFEIIAFDNGFDDGSDMRKRLRNAFDEMVDLTAMDDLEAARAVKARKIDILVDLNGYFGLGRPGLFAHKPSPVQVNYLGFPGTVGAGHMDYLVADRHVVPPEHQPFYREKIVYLPDTYQVNDARRVIAPVAYTRSLVGLPEEGFVFCCFNNVFKITPKVFDVWMRILQQVEGSVLWLLEDNKIASRNLRQEAQNRGVSPDRLIFAERWMELDKHLARHAVADLFLDTLPCNAHTTASDALWAGLPVLTCMGQTFPGRVAGSLLHAVGLPELTTQSLEEYERLAVKIATEPALAAELKARLASNKQTYPLFDVDRSRRHLEAAYTTMWERAQRGEAPESFSVPAIHQ